MLSPIQTLCNSLDCSPPGSSIQEISQARILEWDPPGDPPDPGVDPESPGVAWGFFTIEPPVRAELFLTGCQAQSNTGPSGVSGVEPL